MTNELPICLERLFWTDKPGAMIAYKFICSLAPWTVLMEIVSRKCRVKPKSEYELNEIFLFYFI